MTDRKIYTADEIKNLIKVSKATGRASAHGAKIDPKDFARAMEAQEAVEIEMFTAGLLAIQSFVSSQERIASALEKIADNDAATRERLNRSIEREKL